MSPGSREFDERCAKLLAQAALGGDVWVLQEISSAILLLGQDDIGNSVDGGGISHGERSGVLSRCELTPLTDNRFSLRGVDIPGQIDSRPV